MSSGTARALGHSGTTGSAWKVVSAAWTGPLLFGSIGATSFLTRGAVLNGADKSEADLVAAGDKLEAKGLKLAKGAKAVATLVTLAAKAITVRFTVR